MFSKDISQTIVPFVIGTYSTSDVPSEYSVKEQRNVQMISNMQMIYFEHWSAT